MQEPGQCSALQGMGSARQERAGARQHTAGAGCVNEVTREGKSPTMGEGRNSVNVWRVERRHRSRSRAETEKQQQRLNMSNSKSVKMVSKGGTGQQGGADASNGWYLAPSVRVQPSST